MQRLSVNTWTRYSSTAEPNSGWLPPKTKAGVSLRAGPEAAPEVTTSETVAAGFSGPTANGGLTEL